MSNTFIINANIVNEGEIFFGDIELEDGIIKKISKRAADLNSSKYHTGNIIDANGKYLIPGVIDCHVHFREPGLTHKADIHSESKAAVAGGVTSYMEMPNTIPNATNLKILEEKYSIAAGRSLANYSFFIGGSNNNLSDLLSLNKKNVCGIKLFLGASTGNMLTNDQKMLEDIFSGAQVPVAVHCEDEQIIKKNTDIYKEKYGDNITFDVHPEIRSEEACLQSTKYAIELARKLNTRLHITHLSTAAELQLLGNSLPLNGKRITAEVCPHYLWFDDSDYHSKKGYIKCNPSIKKLGDKEALFEGLLNDKIDIITTDHAPHTIDEKEQPYFSCPSGIASVEHSLLMMLEFFHSKKMSIEKIVEKMCHAPAKCYQVEKRGFIKEGYWADLVILEMNCGWTADRGNILSKCGWSPYEGTLFHSKITHTFVNGNMVFCNGRFNEHNTGKRLLFDR